MTSKFIIARKIFCATVSVIILSCAGNQDKVQAPQAEYNPEHLERPPQIVDYSAEKKPESIPAQPGTQETMDEPPQQTYNPNVMLSEMAGSDTKIIIRELFSKSWSMVSKALTEKAFSVSDRDRDNGLFYVKFDPDAQEDSENSAWDNVVSFLVKDQSGEGEYHLKLEQRESVIDVTAEMIEDDSFDDEDDLVDPDKSVEMFLTALFKILREL